MQTVMILGRQTGIALAELESLYGPENIRAVSTYAAIINAETIDFARTGGSIKSAQLLDTLNTTNWRELQKYLERTIPKQLKSLGEGKLSLGLSAYGFDITPQKITATGLNLKKVIRASGRSTRLVPNNEMALNSAQVLHNKLTSPLGWELLLIKDGAKTILAKTTHEQDIEAYTLRDRGRPKRDARVGMLPPKLAQIIVNLAISDTTPSHATEIFDPFCGTGVILQEASLMGFGVAGSDIDPRMVEYTDTNLQWLRELNPNSTAHNENVHLKVADATQDDLRVGSFIATETYLGRAFTTPPPLAMLEKNRQDSNTIIRKFLKNIHALIKPGFRLSLALPAWFDQGQVYHLPLLDSLGEIGYNRMEFKHVALRDLIYHREDQIVGRELVVLVRK